jgi:hypothetical protein
LFGATAHSYAPVEMLTATTPPFSPPCRVPGYTIAEGTLMPADVERANEVFITSTTRNPQPVVELEGRAIPLRFLPCSRLPQGKVRRHDLDVRFSTSWNAAPLTHGGWH